MRHTVNVDMRTFELGEIGMELVEANRRVKAAGFGGGEWSDCVVCHNSEDMEMQ